MEKIEKVIKGIEKCIAVPGMCRGCPYEKCDEVGRQLRDCSTDVLRDALELLKSQQAEIERLKLSGEWKRMSDLPIETDDRFECSICGNVVHYRDRINLYTFNDYCGRCGAYNGFKLRTVSRNDNKR